MYKEEIQAKQKEVRLFVDEQGKDKQFYLAVDNDDKKQPNVQKLKLSDEKGLRLLMVGYRDRKLIVEDDQRQRFELKLVPSNDNSTQDTLTSTPILLKNKPITYQQLLIAHNTISSLKEDLAEQQSQIQSLRQQLSQAKKQSQISEQANKQNQIKEKQNQQLQISFPEPVPYDSISFLDDGKEVSYTDCWEISLLRFLHLLFGKDGKIDQKKLTKLMDPDDQLCQKLIQYFRDNPTYEMKRTYYTTKQGYKIRAEWAQFLNNTGILHLKKPNEKGQMKYEVAATVPNLITFLSNFFPKLVLIYQLPPLAYSGIVSKELFKSYSEALQKIYNQFASVSQFQIKFSLSHKVQPMHDMIWFSSVQHFGIKRTQQQPQQHLQWEIYEYYQCCDLDSSQREIVKRFTGHSDFRFAKSYL